MFNQFNYTMVYQGWNWNLIKNCEDLLLKLIKKMNKWISSECTWGITVVM